jgi:magnesium chelatase family protein
MNFSKLHSAQVTMLKAEIIDVEVDITNGLHNFTIVGLTDKAIEESRDRVSAAIKNSGFTSPKQRNQKIIISLAPANMRKEGPVFDLPIALSYLLASGDIEFDPEKKIFLGELSLDGEVRPISGVLPLVKEVMSKGFEEVYVPKENAKEAALISGIKIFPTENLLQIIEHLSGTDNKIKPQEKTILEKNERNNKNKIDFSDISGQESAKRGLQIAAAGGHSAAMSGAPGTGKTMLAKAFCGLLPELDMDEALEVTAIHSVAKELKSNLITEAPFRSPHHTASYVSLVGGGSVPKPGEATLAHRGVLFLDEFPEFERRVIDSLRQPLEERVITVSRARGTAHFPADFILVAAMNPCPCGYLGIVGKKCVCSPNFIASYKRKISGPILDRIDIWVDVESIKHEELSKIKGSKTTSQIREAVIKARNIQIERFKKSGYEFKLNAQIPGKLLQTISPLSLEVEKFFNNSAKHLDLSARAYHRVWRVAQTIADLKNSPSITIEDMLEALQYRPKVN